MVGMETKAVLAKARLCVERSGLTYQAIGERMGYAPSSARQHVWQFLHGPNPSVAMLRKFAEAVGVEPKELM
jgi:transcriptional regulator with XRE-family HTH domain